MIKYMYQSSCKLRVILVRY